MTILLLASLTGFLVAIITFLADKFGHKVGGLIATAPVTATIGVIFVLKNSPAHMAENIVLAGNYSVISSLFAIASYFYIVKFCGKLSNALKVTLGEAIFFIIYIGLVLVLRKYLPIGWYLFAISFLLIMASYFFFMQREMILPRRPVEIKRTPKELFVRFISGFAAFLVINFFSHLETVLAGAIAVFPGVFATSIGIMGIKQSAEFSAKAIQSGVFGVAAITMFVLGYSLWIPFLSSGNHMAIAGATASALALYFLSIIFFAKTHTRT